MNPIKRSPVAAGCVEEKVSLQRRYASGTLEENSQVLKGKGQKEDCEVTDDQADSGLFVVGELRLKPRDYRPPGSDRGRAATPQKPPGDGRCF